MENWNSYLVGDIIYGDIFIFLTSVTFIKSYVCIGNIYLIIYTDLNNLYWVGKIIV